MRVVVAPDKFKGSLTAVEAAEAIAEGLRQGRPEVDVVLAPVADGGDGTVDAAAARRLWVRPSDNLASIMTPGRAQTARHRSPRRRTRPERRVRAGKCMDSRRFARTEEGEHGSTESWILHHSPG